MGQVESGPNEDETFAMEEGSAKIYFPKGKSTEDCFYNPVQAFNRDLTTTIIAVFRESLDHDISILQAFSASGLRSIRYALECKGIEKIIANDFDQTAFEIISRNIEINGVSDIVKASKEDPKTLMLNSPKMFDFIDIDPSSTSAPFLDAAVKAAKNGAILCITSTDGRYLSGAQPDAAYALYGSMPISSPFSHEFGIRILLTLLMSTAARYKRAIEPLICFSANYFFRLFVRIRDKPSLSQQTSEQTSIVLYSPTTECFWLQKLGEVVKKGESFTVVPSTVSLQFTTDPYTGEPLKVCGPIYNGPLHNKEFIKKVLQKIPQMKFVHTIPRMEAVLNTCLSELEFPFYYEISSMCNIIKSSTPPRALIISEIERHGFQTSLSHCKSNVIKTNAPNDLLWDILKKHFLNEKPLPEDKESVQYKILSTPFKYEIDLSIDHEVEMRLRKEKQICRFFESPASSFGPRPASRKQSNPSFSPIIPKPARSPSNAQITL